MLQSLPCAAFRRQGWPGSERLKGREGPNYESSKLVNRGFEKTQDQSENSHHYVNDIMQLQSLRHEVEDKCALFEYVSTEDRHELISFMAVAQSRDSRPSASKCAARYSYSPLNSSRKYNRAAGKLQAAQ